MSCIVSSTQCHGVRKKMANSKRLQDDNDDDVMMMMMKLAYATSCRRPQPGLISNFSFEVAPTIADTVSSGCARAFPLDITGRTGASNSAVGVPPWTRPMANCPLSPKQQRLRPAGRFCLHHKESRLQAGELTARQ